MADFALGLTKTALEGTLSRVKSAIEDEANLKVTVQHDLVFITGEFQMMQSFLMVATKERTNNQVVKTWVRQLRDLAFDVEDCVEFVVHLDKSSTWSWMWRLVPSCMAPPRHLDAAVAEIKQLKARVEEVSQRNARYNLISNSAGSKQHASLAPPAAAVFDSVVAEVFAAQSFFWPNSRAVAQSSRSLFSLSFSDVWARLVSTVFLLAPCPSAARLRARFPLRKATAARALVPLNPSHRFRIALAAAANPSLSIVAKVRVEVTKSPSPLSLSLSRSRNFTVATEPPLAASLLALVLPNSGEFPVMRRRAPSLWSPALFPSISANRSDSSQTERTENGLFEGDQDQVYEEEPPQYFEEGKFILSCPPPRAMKAEPSSPLRERSETLLLLFLCCKSASPSPELRAHHRREQVPPTPLPPRDPARDTGAIRFLESVFTRLLAQNRYVFTGVRFIVLDTPPPSNDYTAPRLLLSRNTMSSNGIPPAGNGATDGSGKVEFSSPELLRAAGQTACSRAAVKAYDHNLGRDSTACDRRLDRLAHCQTGYRAPPV
nr:unnamed protein product [Digitaria exilis]